MDHVALAIRTTLARNGAQDELTVQLFADCLKHVLGQASKEARTVIIDVVKAALHELFGYALVIVASSSVARGMERPGNAQHAGKFTFLRESMALVDAVARTAPSGERQVLTALLGHAGLATVFFVIKDESPWESRLDLHAERPRSHGPGSITAPPSLDGIGYWTSNDVMNALAREVREAQREREGAEAEAAVEAVAAQARQGVKSKKKEAKGGGRKKKKKLSDVVDNVEDEHDAKEGEMEEERLREETTAAACRQLVQEEAVQHKSEWQLARRGIPTGAVNVVAGIRDSHAHFEVLSDRVAERAADGASIGIDDDDGTNGTRVSGSVASACCEASEMASVVSGDGELPIIAAAETGLLMVILALVYRAESKPYGAYADGLPESELLNALVRLGIVPRSPDDIARYEAAHATGAGRRSMYVDREVVPEEVLAMRSSLSADHVVSYAKADAQALCESPAAEDDRHAAHARDDAVLSLGSPGLRSSGIHIDDMSDAMMAPSTVMAQGLPLKQLAPGGGPCMAAVAVDAPPRIHATRGVYRVRALSQLEKLADKKRGGPVATKVSHLGLQQGSMDGEDASLLGPHAVFGHIDQFVTHMIRAGYVQRFDRGLRSSTGTDADAGGRTSARSGRQGGAQETVRGAGAGAGASEEVRAKDIRYVLGRRALAEVGISGLHAFCEELLGGIVLSQAYVDQSILKTLKAVEAGA